MSGATRRDSFWPALGVTLALAFVGMAGGCAVAQTVPSKPRPIGEVVREAQGEVMSVRDTTVDLRTGRGRTLPGPSPRVPLGPIAVRVPVTVGGEKRVEMPAEEITVRLKSGEIIVVVQELSSPPFATGERVRVLYGRPDESTGQTRIKVERE